MGTPFKQPTTNIPVYFGPLMIDRFTAWEKGPWFIVHKEMSGAPLLWRHRLQLFPVVYGKGERKGEGIYAERVIEPYFSVENGAVAAILFARIIQDMGEVDGFAVSEKWQAIANELDWKLSYVPGSDERCERCYVAMDTAREWLKDKDAAL